MGDAAVCPASNPVATPPESVPLSVLVLQSFTQSSAPEVGNVPEVHVVLPGNRFAPGVTASPLEATGLSISMVLLPMFPVTANAAAWLNINTASTATTANSGCRSHRLTPVPRGASSRFPTMQIPLPRDLRPRDGSPMQRDGSHAHHRA